MSDFVTEARLEEAEARAHAASPGEWAVRRSPCSELSIVEAPRRDPSHPYAVELLGEDTHAELYPAEQREADVVFVAHSKADVLALASEVRRLRGLLGGEVPFGSLPDPRALALAVRARCADGYEFGFMGGEDGEWVREALDSAAAEGSPIPYVQLPPTRPGECRVSVAPDGLHALLHRLLYVDGTAPDPENDPSDCRCLFVGDVLRSLGFEVA